MNRNKLLFISDANLDYLNSTRKLLLDAVNSEFAKQNSVHFLCASSSRVTKFDNITAVRVPFYKSKNRVLRVFSELYFQLVVCTLLLLKFFQTRKVAFIVPPIGASFSIMVAKKVLNKKIYLIQRDLFPFNYLDTGVLKENSFVFKVGRRLFEMRLTNSDEVGFENKQDLNKIKDQFPDINSVFEVLPNWISPLPDAQSSKIKKSSNKIIYCGNLGHMQDTPQIESFIISLEKQNFFSFDIFGFGRDFEKLSDKYSKYKQTQFYSAIDDKALSEILPKYRYGIVTLRSSNQTNNLPGKLFLYLSADLIIVGSASLSSELSHIVNNSQVGLITSANQKNSLFRGLCKVRDLEFNDLAKHAKKILYTREVTPILEKVFR